ncbi:MAG: serine--tRNA ligase [Patescibacteria group bacterium]|nr:serine--tRNA ligase [Patescibacteria group bacterium]
MLDPKLIRENPDLIKKTCKQKGIKLDVDKLLQIDEEKREILKQVEALKAEKNKASEKIAQLDGEEKKSAIAEMQKVSEEEKKLIPKLQELEAEFLSLALLVPTPQSKETPEGKDDTENVELRTWGELPKFDFQPLDHVTLAEKCDLVDMPRGAKVAGTRSYYLKNEGAQLEVALLMYTWDKLIEKGFTPMIVPNIVNYQPMMGTSYFPGGEEQAYAVGVERVRGEGVESDNKYLAGTAEVALTSYRSDEILSQEDLPLKSCGWSTCYRREAGTYGKDTHGLYRVHQFQKIEQVIVCEANMEKSQEMHDLLLKNAEEVLQDLNLPYRVVAVCTGDMGQGQYYKNDIETWMPSRESYGETHSCSNFLDFQARRLNLRYKDNEGKIKFCYTLNNTCIASPRVLIPILEIYQQKDGSIAVPEVLQKYMGNKKTIDPR